MPVKKFKPFGGGKKLGSPRGVIDIYSKIMIWRNPVIQRATAQCVSLRDSDGQDSGDREKNQIISKA